MNKASSRLHSIFRMARPPAPPAQKRRAGSCDGEWPPQTICCLMYTSNVHPSGHAWTRPPRASTHGAGACPMPLHANW